MGALSPPAPEASKVAAFIFEFGIGRAVAAIPGEVSERGGAGVRIGELASVVEGALRPGAARELPLGLGRDVEVDAGLLAERGEESSGRFGRGPVASAKRVVAERIDRFRRVGGVLGVGVRIAAQLDVLRLGGFENGHVEVVRERDPVLMGFGVELARAGDGRRVVGVLSHDERAAAGGDAAHDKRVGLVAVARKAARNVGCGGVEALFEGVEINDHVVGRRPLGPGGHAGADGAGREGLVGPVGLAVPADFLQGGGVGLDEAVHVAGERHDRDGDPRPAAIAVAPLDGERDDGRVVGEAVGDDRGAVVFDAHGDRGGVDCGGRHAGHGEAQGRAVNGVSRGARGWERISFHGVSSFAGGCLSFSFPKCSVTGSHAPFGAEREVSGASQRWLRPSSPTTRRAISPSPFA